MEYTFFQFYLNKTIARDAAVLRVTSMTKTGLNKYLSFNA